MDDILRFRGGYDRNNLLNILKDIDNYEELVSTTSESPYIEPSNVPAYLENFKKQFLILDINIQSLNAKFENLQTFLGSLAEEGISFSAICIQETWISPSTFPSTNFEIPDYTSYFLPASCSSHSGLVVYVKNTFQVRDLNLYKNSQVWEGQFLEISGGGLQRKLSLCNIYRPPRDRNRDIQIFLNEITPVISTVSNMYADSIIAGDFNLDLLKIDSRILISDYIELMYSHSYSPSITLPTRLTRRNATLIDQIFCKSSSNVQGGIILSNISDHLFSFICVDLQQTFGVPPKTVSFQQCDTESVNKFVNAIENIDFSAHISTSPNSNPDTNFEIVKSLIDDCLSQYLPYRTVKFNRYQHKINPWITKGILKSIKNRDKMYKEMKTCNPDSQEYDRQKRNIQSYNNLIKKLIRCSKQSYYYNLFLRNKNDSRKSWKS